MEQLSVPKNLLPFDFTREVPTKAFKWLLQYGLPYSYWKDKVAYSPMEERLLFLIGEPLQFSIGRFVGTPKLGEKAPAKWKCWGDSHKHCETIGTGTEQTILVEDVVSGHRVAGAVEGASVVPLFGTQVHPCHLYYLINKGKPIVLWLDKDQQGTIMKKAAKLSVLANCQVRVVSTDKDPKELSQKEINEALRTVS